MINLGKKHSSKPVTKTDKKMSIRHHANRERVNDMPENTNSQKIIKLKNSVFYNKKHGQEHAKEGKKASIKLTKLQKSFAKRKNA